MKSPQSSLYSHPMSPVAVGKRLKCANCETEVIVVKGTDGDVECCGQPMEEREA